MKKVGIATILGVLIALPIIYYLHPLNNGAVALVVLLSLGFAGIIIKMFSKIIRKRG